jgi:hypothetical protein
MKQTNVLWLLGLTICLGSCSVSRVITDADPNMNLSSYHTFRFTDSDDQSDANPLYHSSILENAIHAQIAIELEKRGVLENMQHPDMLVAYHTFTEKKKSSVNDYYPMMYGGWSWRFYSGGLYPYGYWNGYNRTYEYTEGTLIVDAIDVKSNQLIWRGSISDAINNPGNLHTTAIKAVKLVFKKFPIKANDTDAADSKPLAVK